MNPDSMPVWVILIGSIVTVMVSIELGYLLGHAAHRKAEDEKEAPVSAISASVLGLLAFMLAFTFDIVAERYETRKGLVREEANAIRTVWLRTDILPQGNSRHEARQLLRDYVDQRLALAGMKKLRREDANATIAETKQIQTRLWEIAVLNAPPGPMNSDMASLFLGALNDIIGLQATRVTVSVHARVPSIIWLTLYTMMVMGMMGVGYQTGVAGSRRSNARAILAIAFSLVIALIATLDRPDSSVLRVSQQPLNDLRSDMNGGSE